MVGVREHQRDSKKKYGNVITLANEILSLTHTTFLFLIYFRGIYRRLSLILHQYKPYLLTSIH